MKSPVRSFSDIANPLSSARRFGARQCGGLCADILVVEVRAVRLRMRRSRNF